MVTPTEMGTGARIELRELLRILNRRKWQILGVAGLVCALAAVILAQTVPEYRATASVMLDTRKLKVTNTADVMGAIQVDIPAIQTEIEVLRSATLLSRVVDKLHLDQDPEYGAAAPSFLSKVRTEVWAEISKVLGTASRAADRPTPPDAPRLAAITALGRNLQIAARGRSFVISISLDSRDPQKAKHILDTVTDFYIVDQLQAKLDANKRATDFFSERLEELRRAVETAESAVAQYREQFGLTLGKDVTITTQSLSELNSQLVQARAQRADRESRLVALQQAARNPATLGGVSEVLGNPLISALRAQEAEVGRRIGDLAQRYGDNHPRLLQARSEQAQIQGRISAEVGKIIASVKGDAEAARAKEAELQSQVDRLEHEAGGRSQSEVKLKQLEREAQSSRAVYEDFLKRFKELREQQDLQQPDARILSPAEVPRSPVFPRYALTMAMALAAGLVAGMIFVGLMERLDGGFRSGAQVERLTGRAVVGMIPAVSRLQAGRKTPARYAIDRPNAAFSEALRSTLTAITLGSLDKPPKVVMVTSALPGEGKTTFITSLGGLIARSSPDKKVIVVDGDLRRSSVTKSLDVPQAEATIDEYLVGTKSLDEVIGRDEESGVYYVGARSNTPNSAEILDSNAMANFLKALSEKFDLVLVDTPPVMAVSDARVAVRHVDYVVYLIRWEQTAREVAINSLQLLRDIRVPVGVVLTQVDVRRHAKYGYGDYGYYYSKYRDYYTR